MRIPSFVPQRFHGAFHPRHRRRLFGGCGCGSLFTCLCLATIVLALLSRR